MYQLGGIAVVSDLHNREYGEHNGALLSDLRALKPDLILFPGDMVIREQDDYQPMLDFVSASAAIAPCWGVLGNHGSERIYYRNDKALPERFEDAGLRLLRNACGEIRIGDSTVQLFGVEGTAYGFEQYGGREFMETPEIDPGAYSVVMAHIPILFDSQLSGYDFDLGIAGHVHGGIVRLPLIGRKGEKLSELQRRQLQFCREDRTGAVRRGRRAHPLRGLPLGVPARFPFR